MWGVQDKKPGLDSPVSPTPRWRISRHLCVSGMAPSRAALCPVMRQSGLYRGWRGCAPKDSVPARWGGVPNGAQACSLLAPCGSPRSEPLTLASVSCRGQDRAGFCCGPQQSPSSLRLLQPQATSEGSATSAPSRLHTHTPPLGLLPRPGLLASGSPPKAIIGHPPCRSSCTAPCCMPWWPCWP